MLKTNAMPVSFPSLSLSRSNSVSLSLPAAAQELQVRRMDATEHVHYLCLSAFVCFWLPLPLPPPPPFPLLIVVISGIKSDPEVVCAPSHSCKT